MTAAKAAAQRADARPVVAVDLALLTVLPGDDHLSVLQVRRADAAGWELPTTPLEPGERLVDAVRRSLLAKAGTLGAAPRQLRVFDDVRRDEQGWTLSVGHVDVVRAEQLSTRVPERTRLVAVARPGRLSATHAATLDLAVAEVRQRYATLPDPDALLTEPFTVLTLRRLHEAVAGAPLQRDTFRRLMEPNLDTAGVTSTGGRGRPAELYRRRTDTRRPS